MSIVQTDCQHCQTGTRDGVEQPPEQAHFMASSQTATEPSEAMSTLMNAYKNKGLFFSSSLILISKVWVIFVILHFDHMIAEKIWLTPSGARVLGFSIRHSREKHSSWHSVLHCTLYIFYAQCNYDVTARANDCKMCEREFNTQI